MIRTLLLFSGLLLTQVGHAQIDSLHNELAKTSGNTRVDILTEIAASFRTTSPDSVSKYAKQALSSAQESNYTVGLSKAYKVLGLSKSLLSEYDSALIFYNKALKLMSHNITSELIADIQMGIGGAYLHQSELEIASTHFISAAEIYETLNKEKRMAAAYSNLGIIMNASDQDEKALNYFHKALKIANQHNIIGTKLPALVNLGSLFLKQEQYDSSIFYADMCYRISAQQQMTFGMARSLVILAEAYSRSELFVQGLASAEEGISLFQKMNNLRSTQSMQHQKALALNGLGRYNEALIICQSLIEETEPDNSLREQIYFLMHEIYAALGNHQKALVYHMLYFEQYKKVETKHREDAVLQLEAKYETERKSREIELLQKEAEFQEIKIQQQNWMIAGAIIFFAVLVLIIVLYSRHRSLRKQNEMLSLEHRFLRFQMNPHFIFNALGAIQKFVITNNPIESASFISKFSGLMRQVLEHSREDYITIANEVAALNNYLDLQKLRFNDKFDFIIEVDEIIDEENTFIQPMFAQPFIENALEHGISELKKRGHIAVKFKSSASGIELLIDDNGLGLEQLTPQSEKHISLATTITNARIARIGENAELSIENIIDDKGDIAGVRVRLLLPTKQH